MNNEIRHLAQHLLHAGMSPLSERETAIADLHDKVDRLTARIDGFVDAASGRAEAGRTALRAA